MSHQEDAIEYGAPRNAAAFLMQMRLGKTLVTIRYAEERKRRENKDTFRVLLLAPPNVLPNWEKELDAEGHEWLRAYRGSSIDALLKVRLAQHIDKPIIWVLMNYEAILRIPEISDLGWDLVVLDESTKIKNPRAKISKILVNDHIEVRNKEEKTKKKIPTGFQNTANKAILTGAISPESELEVFQQMKFLYGSFMNCKDHDTFRRIYFQNVGFGKYAVKPMYKEDIKRSVHQRAFVLKRDQAGIGEKKFYDKRYVYLQEGQQEDTYRKIEEEFYYELTKEGETELKETMFKLVVYQWLAKLASGFSPEIKSKTIEDLYEPISNAKAESIWEMYRENMWGEPLVIWCRYRHELIWLKHYFDSKFKEEDVPWRCSFAMGKTDQHKILEPSKAKFNSGENKFMIATTKYAKMGEDYSIADTAIYYSNDPSGEARLQSEDRLVHPMKKDRPLYYYDMVTADTIDEDLSEMMKVKTTNAMEFMDAFKSSFIQRMKEQRESEQKVGAA